MVNHSSSSTPNPPDIKKPLRLILYTLIATATLTIAYNMTTNALVKRWDDKAPRNPTTGVLLGAEDQWLGPQTAPTAILFIHGFIGAGNNFAQLPQLTADAGYRVRVMRLPGHGTTPIDFAKTSLDRLIQAVQHETQALKQKHRKVILIGHSMGAALATLTAANQQIDGLILGAPYFAVTHKWYYILSPETWTTLTAPILHWIYRPDSFIRIKRTEVRDQIIAYRWIPAPGAKLLNELGRQVRNPQTLAAITCPTLLIISEDDQAANPAAAHKALSQIASETKQTLSLQNSDHHIFWDHDRQEVYDTTLKFIKEITNTPN